MNEKITYRRATQADIIIATDLLFRLYNDEGQAPDLTKDELLAENKRLFADKSQVFFLSFSGDTPVGVSNGSLRREYVNGTNDELKGYLESIYVLPDYRKCGIAAGLVKITEGWAAKNGCREMASDCLLDNTDSYKFHLKIGYKETERNIFFLKQIEPIDDKICQLDKVGTEMLQEFSLSTPREDFYNITSQLRQAISTSGVKDGIAVVFCPHTTAGITINENADPDVVRDMLLGLAKAYPDRAEFRHGEGNSTAHLKASAVGSSVTVIVKGGKPVLGTWQSVWFCEFDPPRSRKFYVKVM